MYRASSSELKVTSAKPKSLPWTSPKWARLLATTSTEPSQTPPHTQDNAGDVVGVEGAGDDSQADAVIRDKLVDHMQGPEAGVHKEVAHGLHKGALEDMAPTLDKRFHSSLGHHRE